MANSLEQGTACVQPLWLHQHWHIDVSYINIGGTFYFFCSLLDGCGHYLVHWGLRESMQE